MNRPIAARAGSAESACNPKASIRAPSGRSRASSSVVPERTWKPSSPAWVKVSPSSRVFPIPASPRMTAALPAPLRASRSTCRRGRQLPGSTKERECFWPAERSSVRRLHGKRLRDERLGALSHAEKGTPLRALGIAHEVPELRSQPRFAAPGKQLALADRTPLTLPGPDHHEECHGVGRDVTVDPVRRRSFDSDRSIVEDKMEAISSPDADVVSRLDTGRLGAVDQCPKIEGLDDGNDETFQRHRRMGGLDSPLAPCCLGDVVTVH